MKRCESCGTQNTHDGFFCRNCGNPLPTPPRQKRPVPPKSVGREAPPESVRCSHCGALAQGGHMFCPACGGQLPTLSEPLSRASGKRDEESPGQSTDRGHPAVVRPGAGSRPSPGLDAGTWGRLVSVHRDGTDGEIYPLANPTVDIGSGRAEIRLGNDEHLADRHLRLERVGDATKAEPLDELNGVYLRIREATELLSGAELLIGREVLRLVLIPEHQREIHPLTQHGQLLFASPERAPWLRLSHLWRDGAIGDVRHFCDEIVIIGREEGDLVFPDDDFISRRHAQLSLSGTRCVLEDLGSSNGTFVRIDGATLVRHGDTIRLGDHMFRYEAEHP